MPNIPAIKARYEAASEAPWTVGHEAQLNMVAECGEANNGLSLYVFGYHLAPAEADAEFIAHARTDIPQLVTALEEAQALLQRWRYAEGGAEQERLYNETMVALGESQ